MLFPFAVARETSCSWRRHVHPCFAHPSGCRVFIAKSKTEFQHPAGSAIPSGLSSVGKRCEQRKTKTSDGMTFAHKRSRHIIIFDNLRNIFLSRFSERARSMHISFSRFEFYWQVRLVTLSSLLSVVLWHWGEKYVLSSMQAKNFSSETAHVKKNKRVFCYCRMKLKSHCISIHFAK